jgi:hypothetical protein
MSGDEKGIARRIVESRRKREETGSRIMRIMENVPGGEPATYEREPFGVVDKWFEAGAAVAHILEGGARSGDAVRGADQKGREKLCGKLGIDDNAAALDLALEDSELAEGGLVELLDSFVEGCSLELGRAVDGEDYGHEYRGAYPVAFFSIPDKWTEFGKIAAAPALRESYGKVEEIWTEEGAEEYCWTLLEGNRFLEELHKEDGPEVGGFTGEAFVTGCGHEIWDLLRE